jgi:hypothetical protein
MGAACGCNENVNNQIREINDFLDDLILSKTSINEYTKNLTNSIKNKDKKFYNKQNFIKEFLRPLLAVNNDNYKEIQILVENCYLNVFNEKENPTLFIMSLIFLSDSINHKIFKTNYDTILIDIIPNELTKNFKQKSDLRVFKKIFKFYVKLITQYIISATEVFFTRNQNEKNEIGDLKIIYGNLYINEYIKNLFKNENEREFNLEKFLYINYEDLKHFKVADKIYEIYQITHKNDHTLEKEIMDLTDEFSEYEEEDIYENEQKRKLELLNKYNDLKNAPEIIGNNKINYNENENNENDNDNDYNDNLHINFIKEKIERNSNDKIIIEENININNDNIYNKDDIVECEPENQNENQYENKPEEDYIEIDPITLNKIVDLINKFIRGYLFRKKFERLRPKLEAQDRKIQEYIITKFTSEKVKKAENQKTNKFDIDGWKKYYTQNKEIEKITQNQENLIETKFSIFENKEYYSGTFNKKNQKHGFGVCITRQSDKYQGYWLENNYNGWGELIDKKGTIWYGQFVNGKFTGKGEKYTLDGNCFIGDFENFEKNGVGEEDTEFYNYKGTFKNDKKQGKGKIYMKLLKDVYEGDFLNDCITGNGEYHWANKNLYIGEFLNGKMHGKGINKWPDGTCYEGDYVNGIKEGYGKYTKPNGKIYVGGFKEGKPHGLGKLISSKGEIDVEFNKGNIVSDKK